MTCYLSVGGRQATVAHTLRTVIEETQKLTGREIEGPLFDKGCRGHDAPPPGRIFISGEKRGVFGVIKRELRRRSAIDCDGHLETEGYLGRRHLKGRAGHAANAILAAVGYDLQCILAWDRLPGRNILSFPIQSLNPTLNGRLIHVVPLFNTRKDRSGPRGLTMTQSDR
jgi:IS5 family transposase